MKPFIFFLFLLSVSDFAFANKNVAHHPAPKLPTYLNTKLYGSFKKALIPQPQPGSAAQIADEDELLKLQGSRAVGECQSAKNEVLVSLQSFFGEPDGSLDQEVSKKLNPFFEKIRNDSDFFILKMKKVFPRKRPFAYVKGLAPCVPREVTGAYPSGHAALSKLYSLILGDIFPKDKDKFERRALEIGKHRVLAGMHHPSDIVAGRDLAEKIYVELMKSKKFKADLKKYSIAAQ